MGVRRAWHFLPGSRYDSAIPMAFPRTRLSPSVANVAVGFESVARLLKARTCGSRSAVIIASGQRWRNM